jgi:hypothetical protein
MGGLSRRTFIASGAAAAAGAAIAAAPKIVGDHAAADASSAATLTEPTTAAPREPVMAFVRDATRGEVTVMSGTHEATYRDPALVKRLLNAAPALPGLEGGTNVITP